MYHLEVRGRHIGKQLIEYVQKQATEHNCDRLYWHTQESNHTAQKLYDWIAQKARRYSISYVFKLTE